MTSIGNSLTIARRKTDGFERNLEYVWTVSSIVRVKWNGNLVIEVCGNDFVKLKVGTFASEPISYDCVRSIKSNTSNKSNSCLIKY